MSNSRIQTCCWNRFTLASALTLFAISIASGQAPLVEETLVEENDQVAPAKPEQPAADPNNQVAQVAAAEQPAADKRASDELRFSFAGTPWREVIQWLADQGDLALHVSDVPTGSFTYSDPAAYTHQDAMDRVNLFLLPQGFTVVRSGKLLSVINLGDPRSVQQLNTLAASVTISQLDQQNDHDVVKCFFPLGELEPEEAVQELAALNLMTTPAVFEKTKQLMIVDTAAKLKNVKAILAAFVAVGRWKTGRS